jgi:hypothetical protein
MASHVGRPYHVAIVGSGPSGFFAAASLRVLHVQPVRQQCFEAARTVVPQRKPAWTGILSSIPTNPRHGAQHHAGRLRRRPELWICRPQRDPSPTCKGSPSIRATPSINVRSKPRTRKGDSQCRCTTKYL